MPKRFYNISVALGLLLCNKEYQNKLRWQVENMWKPAIYNEYLKTIKNHDKGKRPFNLPIYVFKHFMGW